MAREAPCIGFADMADPECIEETVDRNRPACVDGVEQVARRSLANPSHSRRGGWPCPSRTFSVKMSAGVRIKPSVKKSSISFSPKPSMSKALRDTKCFRPSTACAGQMSVPVQRRTTSFSPVFSSISRKAAEPQIGQVSGKT